MELNKGRKEEESETKEKRAVQNDWEMNDEVISGRIEAKIEKLK